MTQYTLTRTPLINPDLCSGLDEFMNRKGLYCVESIRNEDFQSKIQRYIKDISQGMAQIIPSDLVFDEDIRNVDGATIKVEKNSCLIYISKKFCNQYF